jgi:hypothetical protein
MCVGSRLPGTAMQHVYRSEFKGRHARLKLWLPSLESNQKICAVSSLLHELPAASCWLPAGCWTITASCS